MNIPIHKHGWGLIAGPDAIGQFQRKSPVTGGFSRFDAKLVFDGFEDHFGPLQTAGKALAHANDIFAQRFGREKGIKGRNAIYIADRKIQGLCGIGQEPRREIPGSVLLLFKHGEQIPDAPVLSLRLWQGGGHLLPPLFVVRLPGFDESAGRAVLDAQITVFAEMLIEGDIVIDDHLGSKSPIGCPKNPFACYVIAGADTTGTKDAPGQIPVNMGTDILNGIKAGPLDPEPGRSDLQVGS